MEQNVSTVSLFTPALSIQKIFQNEGWSWLKFSLKPETWISQFATQSEEMALFEMQ